MHACAVSKVQQQTAKREELRANRNFRGHHVIWAVLLDVQQLRDDFWRLEILSNQEQHGSHATHLVPQKRKALYLQLAHVVSVGGVVVAYVSFHKANELDRQREGHQTFSLFLSRFSPSPHFSSSS